MRKYLLLVTLLFCLSAKAQQYTVNGNASQINCHCYTLTPNQGNMSGSVWNNNRIDLSVSFDFTFDVNLGCVDGNGADGIAFVLQPISTNVGTSGSGLGFGGISPSIGVTLDTYQNSSPDNDPFYDHIAIQQNGNLNHLAPQNLAGPLAISATSNDVEDCQDHRLRIKWEVSTKTLSVYFDGVARLNLVNDLVATTFGGNPSVFWGFTGSTGGLFNLQKFCTALNPGWMFPVGQNTCVNEPVTFMDTTVSFTTVAKIYWDFGDGSNIDSVNRNPVHVYTAPGVYTVTQRVRGADGCEEINTQSITIGGKPIPDFTTNGECVNTQITFADNSTVANSTINSYYWNLGAAGTFTTASVTRSFTTAGNYNIGHSVVSSLGCMSDTITRIIHIFGQPQADFTVTDSVCLGMPMNFSDISTVPPDTVNFWLWNVDNGAATYRTRNFNHTFTVPGNHTVTLLVSADSSSSCSGLKMKNVFVADKPVAAIRQSSGCPNVSFQVRDSSYSPDGLPITNWWWDLGNGQFSNQQNPTVNYSTTGPHTIRLVVRNSRGCQSDTLTTTVIVNSKPVADFSYDNILCNISDINFRDASAVTGSTINSWSWIYNQVVFSTSQNAAHSFPVGNQRVGLVVSSAAGCISDTTWKTFIIKTKPVVSLSMHDACKGAVVDFTGTETSNIGIVSWQWDFGDGSTIAGNPVQHVYPVNGSYNVKLVGTSTEGCASEIVTGTLNIYGTNAFAGNDTIATSGQPIQLNATGGISYSWTPVTGLSNPNIPNPVATNSSDRYYYLRAFTPEGCESFDTLLIKIYEGPAIYVPNAFTPNGDGLNDILRAIPVGISQFLYFNVYNRWGQMVFSTSDYRKGWDGRILGVKQNTGTFVWMAAAIDYKGNAITRKGTVTIIR